MKSPNTMKKIPRQVKLNCFKCSILLSKKCIEINDEIGRVIYTYNC